jgi:hypothetical protein
MEDRDIVERVGRLVEHEHRLERTHDGGEGGEMTDEDRETLRSIEIELDRCWDLLRQRRARRAAGENPDEAHVRDADTVEHYQQ